MNLLTMSRPVLFEASLVEAVRCLILRAGQLRLPQVSCQNLLERFFVMHVPPQLKLLL